jgi:glutamine amidotransferase-like uncharacterized protein
MKTIRLSFLVLLLLLACGQQGQSADVALYSDRGAAENCLTATKNMFEWMGLGVEPIDAGYINSRSLVGFRIICFPGGDMYQYAQDISESGKSKIRAFISNGGGYIGICGGAYFTGERVYWQGTQLPMSPLAILPGATIGPVDSIAPYPNCVMCKVNITIHDHPITLAEPDSVWIMYCYGPQLIPDENADVDVLGLYDTGGQPVMIAFHYGRGRVFIIGTHPEFEEDSERDGIFFGEDFDDRGSDWGLMRKAALWCTGAEDSE